MHDFTKDFMKALWIIIFILTQILAHYLFIEITLGILKNLSNSNPEGALKLHPLLTMFPTCYKVVIALSSKDFLNFTGNSLNLNISNLGSFTHGKYTLLHL